MTVVIAQSCVSSSSVKVERLSEPDNFLLDEFGLKNPGKIIYQFYQSYGFTDKEEQLIMIVEPGNLDFLTNDLPFDSIEIRIMERIDFRKFLKSGQINFEPDKVMHTDIRLESWEYGNWEKKIFCEEGRYKLVKDDTLETVILYDYMTKLLYVESKKSK